MVVRKRLIYWVIREYLRKSGKTILFSFIAGLLIFCGLLFGSRYFVKAIPIYKKTVVGVSGAYKADALPPFVVEKISRGLTAVDDTGKVMPALAESWEILDEGKRYIFHLKKDQYLSNGRNITSELINYNFSNVRVEHPDPYTIVLLLNEAYAPFLITVSRPIFHPGLVGSGEYRVEDIHLNGNFVQSLTLSGVQDGFDLTTYLFYPSVEALRYAYVLGEVTQAVGLDSEDFGDMTYSDFSNTTVVKKTNYKRMVTLFYNNDDSILFDKKVRLALSYCLPKVYPEGEKSFLPYNTSFIYYNLDITDRPQDYDHAKVLLDASNTASEAAKMKTRLSLKTSAKYMPVAKRIAESIGHVGFVVTIEEVDTVPTDFQLYLGDFTLSNDPDQYFLWHSNQSRNIAKYKNLRIDKLLEDGRRTVDVEERKKIYADFQKFLVEDPPASFLYFPYEYEVRRR